MNIPYHDLQVLWEALLVLTPEQVLLAILGYATIYLSMVSKNATAKRLAPFVGLLGQPLWMYITYTKGLFGMFLVCCGYTWFYALAVFKNIKVQPVESPRVAVKSPVVPKERFDPHAR